MSYPADTVTRPVAAPAPAPAPSSTGSGASPQANARELIAQATDPRTGTLDTQKLGRWVADAGQQDFAAASQAHAAIETELVAQGRVGDLARFNQDVVAAASSSPPHAPGGLWGAGQGMLQQGTKLLVDNPILVKQWESTTSAWTQKGGFTSGLRDLLDSHGIRIEPQINGVPRGSLGPTAGVPLAQANNTNGALARDAIADRWRNGGYNVQTEVPANGGARRVDVVVDVPHADPRLNQRLEIESKVGRTGLDTDIRVQAGLDGEALSANRALRRSGQVLEGVGKVARPIGIALDVISVGQAFQADGNRIGANTGRTVSGVAGGALGGWGGAAAGAAIGTAIFPGVGTAVGGIIGGIAGAIGGDAAGRGLFDTVKGWF
ncbi:MAG TPA: hypothetical protein VGQ91_02940 [Ideonella sp.]|jgi:hypothetical protein|nr:hypothetical protein [Ideonella sp.]